MDLISFGHQYCGYVEHLFHCEIFRILDGMLIVWVISHDCSSNSFPWILLFPMLKTWTFPISQNALRRSLLHPLKIVLVSFAPDHSPCAKMIWILTTNPILFRHLQWWIAVFLLLLEGKQRGSPFYRDFLLPKWRACVHERNVMNLVWPCPRASKQRVSPFFHPTIHQLSTLEKTNLCHHPILSSLLSTSFQQIDGGGLARNMCHGQQRFPRFFNIPLLAYSKNFDFHNFFSPSFLMQKMTELREPLQSDSSLVLTLLWPDSFCVLFDITSKQSVELKWLM